MAPPSASLPPNPCLVAILLVTKNRAGTRLVFHYPPNPSPKSASRKRDANWYGPTANRTDDSESGDSDWSSGSDVGAHSDDEDGSRSSKAGSKGSNKTNATRGSGKYDAGGSLRSSKARSRDELDEGGLDDDIVNHGDGGKQDDTADGKSKEQVRSHWENILGFSAESLSTLLTPGRIFNKRKFEVGLDRLVFVGAPIFKREDGRWVKKRRRQKKIHLDVVDEDGVDPPVNGHDKQDGDSINFSRTASTVDLHQVPGFESGYGHGMMSGAASDAGSETKSTTSSATEGDMDMFNVIFVLNPPQLEHHLRVDEMYNYVARKLAMRLKERQADNNFVSKQALLIQSLKEKGRESRAPIAALWQKILATSVLATALAEVYDKISTNQIAHINLGAGSEPSFQIMQAVSTQVVPSATEPQMPGLWLTTATVIDDDDAETDMSPHSALLLLDDDDNLLREVEGEGDKASALLSFIIRNLTPTKSLLKLSQMHSHAVNLNDVQLVARHLITWRRARAIHPLRGRDTYVVSPNANMAALAEAIPAFAKRFPAAGLPSLPQILHKLSLPPKPYNHMMPSLEHKEKYMDILAWLMRGGWVTQLRSFGWIRVKPEVKAAVAEKMNAEASELKAASHSETADTFSEGSSHTRSTSRQALLRSPETRATTSDWNPGLSPYFSGLARPPSDAGSSTSSRTAVPSIITSLSPLQRPDSRTFHRASPLHINQSASPSSDELSSTNGSQILLPSSTNDSQTELMSTDPADYDASLIHSPQKANATESRWIEYIGASFTDVELKELWPLLLKYFDGRHALEEIPAREGLKKKSVERILKLLGSTEWLVTVRHW